MSFLDHLEELRRRIVYSAVYVVAGFGVCWWFHEKIFGIMQKPIVSALASHHLEQKLVYLESHRRFQHVPEDIVSGWDFCRVTVRALSGLGFHRAGTLPQ